MIARVIYRTGETVAQLVILYGSKSWLVTSEMLKVLIGFHHQVVRLITGMTAKHGAGGDWGYPLVEKAMESAGIHPIRVCINSRQTTIADRVSCCPVYAL